MPSIPAVSRAAAAAVLFASSSPLCLMGNSCDGSFVSRADSTGVYGLKLSMIVGRPQTKDEAQANDKFNEQLHRLFQFGISTGRPVDNVGHQLLFKDPGSSNGQTLHVKYYDRVEELRAAVLSGEVEVFGELMGTGSGRFGNLQGGKAAMGNVVQAYGSVNGLRAALDAGEIKQLARLLGVTEIKTVPEGRTLLLQHYGTEEALRDAVLSGEVEVLVDLVVEQGKAAARPMEINQIISLIAPLHLGFWV